MSFSYVNPLRERLGEAFFASLPDVPGVYFMLGAGGETLYVGKAKSLRRRVASYANAKPGAVGENIVELLEHVRSVRYQICASEEAALLREAELLQAVRPPYNIAGVWEAHYLFWGWKVESPGRVAFQLSSYDDMKREGYRVHGCFRHRSRTKLAYTAFMRLLHACVTEQRRFSYPARITRASPPWRHLAEVPLSGEGFELALGRFLDGRDEGLLALIVGRLLENERVPPFARPGLQEDLELVHAFYGYGPRANREERARQGLRTRVLSHRRMDELVAADADQGQRALSPPSAAAP